MRVAVFLCLIAYASAFYSYLDDVEDIEKKMQDKAAVEEAIACLLDRGPCTEKELENKKHVLGTMMSYCADCEPKEKHKLEVSLKLMLKNYPKEIEEIIKKYDLDGKHYAVIAADLAKY